MGKTVIKEDMFPEIISHYNTGGRKAAYALLRERYGILHPAGVVRRIKRAFSLVLKSSAPFHRQRPHRALLQGNTRAWNNWYRSSSGTGCSCSAGTLPLIPPRGQ